MNTQPQTLAGHTICITGPTHGFSSRAHATSCCIARGATVVNSITKFVTYLVVDSLSANKKTIKTTKALDLGIPLIDNVEFYDVYSGNKTMNFAFAPKTVEQPQKQISKRNVMNTFISQGLKNADIEVCV